MKKVLLFALCLLPTIASASEKVPKTLISDYYGAKLPGKPRALRALLSQPPSAFSADELKTVIGIIAGLVADKSSLLGEIPKAWQVAAVKTDPALARGFPNMLATGKEREEKHAAARELTKEEIKLLENAVKSGNSKMFLDYIHQHPDVVEAVDKDQNTLLMLALMEIYPKPSMEIIRELIKRTKTIDQRDAHQETALMTAAREGNAEAVKLISARGAKINAKDDAGMTPLLNAAEGMQDRETMLLLLKAGADVRAADNDGATALHYAIHDEYRHPECPGCENCQGKEGCAKEEEDEEEEEGEPFDVPTKQQVETVGLLLDRGAHLEAVTTYKDTPLMHATVMGNVPVVKYLIERKADLEALDDAGNTPLMRVVAFHGWKLIDQDSSAADKADSLHKSLLIMQLLLNAGANTNLPQNQPLTLAIGQYDLIAVQQLLVHRADPMPLPSITPMR